MSKTKGILYTCDICGNTEFAETIDKSKIDVMKYYDGDQYKLPSTGWINISKLGDLCPDCHNKYDRMCQQLKDDCNRNAKVSDDKFQIVYDTMWGGTNEITSIFSTNSATVSDLFKLVRDKLEISVKFLITRDSEDPKSRVREQFIYFPHIGVRSIMHYYDDSEKDGYPLNDIREMELFNHEIVNNIEVQKQTRSLLDYVFFIDVKGAV